MGNLPHLQALIGGYLGAPDATPPRLSRTDLLKMAGITSRQLTYYIQCGAVSPPIGRTRSAAYTLDHVKQAKRVRHHLSSEMTVAQIAEAFSRGGKGLQKLRRSTAPAWPRQAQRATIYRVSEGIHVFASEELLPTETFIIKRLLKAGELTAKERLRMSGDLAQRAAELPAKRAPSGRR